MSALLLPFVLLGLQAKSPSTDPKDAIERYFSADWAKPEGRTERRAILAELVKAPLDAASAAATLKLIQKRWEKGPELEKDKGQTYFWPEEKRGLFILGGNIKKPKALALCMHGGGKGEGDAWSAHGGYNAALADLDWLAIYPQVLEKTEHGWTDSGTEEWVLELLERARRTWKIDPNRVFLCGHSMGGYGSWTLGAHHADQIAAIAPSAGAPTPYMDRSGKFTDISAGVIPNLRNVLVRIYQSDNDPNVPPEANRVAAQKLKEAKERWGGFDYEYWEVPGRAHDFPPGGPSALLAKIEKASRTVHPDTVVWQPVLDWVWQSYWLYWEEPVKEAIVVAKADKKTNSVTITCDKSTRGLYVLVDEKLLDPKKEVVVTVGGKETYRGIPGLDLAILLATGARGDRELVYTMRVPAF
jgi:acetyl esterase/lipase